MAKMTIRLLVSTIFVALLVSGWMGQAASAAEYKLRAASIYPSPDVPMSMGKVMQIWQEEVTKLTNGKVTFESFWGAALGSGPDHIDLVQKGAVDVAQTFTWYTPGRFPVHGLCYVLPFGPTDPMLLIKANRKLKEHFPQWQADEKRNNVILVSDPPGGAYDFMSRKPLKTIQDFKGEKVSLVGRYFGRWLPPGATAVVRPMQDRYELLQTGVVNIDLHPFTHFYITKVYELVKNYSSVGIMAGFHAQIFVNLDTYNKLPKEIQEVMIKAGKIAEEKTATEVLPQWQKLCQDELKKAGVTFTEFPKGEIRKWAASLQDIPTEWAAEVEGKGYPGFEILKYWQKTTADLGFSWAREWGKKN